MWKFSFLTRCYRSPSPHKIIFVIRPVQFGDHEIEIVAVNAPLRPHDGISPENSEKRA